MGIDKYKAIRHQYRISEATLLFLGFIGGSLGGIFGMSIWRHKSQKIKFLYGYSLFLIMNLIILLKLI